MKIGIDIGGSHIAIAKVQENKILDKKEYNYDESFKKEIRKNIVKYIKQEVSEILKKEKKKQDKIDKKHKSIRKGGSAKRRETIESRENKSCSPHNTNECPRETELNGRSTARSVSCEQKKIQESLLYTGPRQW